MVSSNISKNKGKLAVDHRKVLEKVHFSPPKFLCRKKDMFAFSKKETLTASIETRLILDFLYEVSAFIWTVDSED